MTGTTARSQDCINNNDNGGIITMKTKEEKLCGNTVNIMASLGA